MFCRNGVRFLESRTVTLFGRNGVGFNIWKVEMLHCLVRMVLIYIAIQSAAFIYEPTKGQQSLQ